LAIARFQEIVSLIVQYKYKKTCVEDQQIQDLIPTQHYTVLGPRDQYDQPVLFELAPKGHISEAGHARAAAGRFSLVKQSCHATRRTFVSGHF